MTTNADKDGGIEAEVGQELHISGMIHLLFLNLKNLKNLNNLHFSKHAICRENAHQSEINSMKTIAW